MGATGCLNENVAGVLLRIEQSADLVTRKVLGNVLRGEIIYVEDINKLYICTQSTDGPTNGVIVEIGI